MREGKTQGPDLFRSVFSHCVLVVCSRSVSSQRFLTVVDKVRQIYYIGRSLLLIQLSVDRYAYTANFILSSSSYVCVCCCCCCECGSQPVVSSIMMFIDRPSQARVSSSCLRRRSPSAPCGCTATSSAQRYPRSNAPCHKISMLLYQGCRKTYVRASSSLGGYDGERCRNTAE